MEAAHEGAEGTHNTRSLSGKYSRWEGKLFELSKNKAILQILPQKVEEQEKKITSWEKSTSENGCLLFPSCG